MHNIPEGICISVPIYYSTGSTNQYNLVSFSASRSNAIYGGSNKFV